MLPEMDMEGIGTEEHFGSCNNDATNITKGKRTKRRLRPLSPCAVTAAMTSSCSSASGGGDYGSFSSTTFEGTDQEEEDMAHCLILLAQGREMDPHHNHQQVEDIKMAEKVMATKIGFECKTCNRTFPSFQALGGHRASHKKPKAMITQEEKKSPPIITTNNTSEFEERKQRHMKIDPPMVSLELGCAYNKGDFFSNMSKSKSKIHECSICGSEFTSGQALGGHMRRHRASNNNSAGAITAIQTSCDVAQVKPRNVLELDLNLPAPDDDLRDSKFQFPVTQKTMVLSAAPALVGCHY